MDPSTYWRAWYDLVKASQLDEGHDPAMVHSPALAVCRLDKLRRPKPNNLSKSGRPGRPARPHSRHNHGLSYRSTRIVRPLLLENNCAKRYWPEGTENSQMPKLRTHNSTRDRHLPILWIQDFLLETILSSQILRNVRRVPACAKVFV